MVPISADIGGRTEAGAEIGSFRRAPTPQASIGPSIQGSGACRVQNRKPPAEPAARARAKRQPTSKDRRSRASGRGG